jgi:GH35 family endo-1,4-beta-xylanase
VHRDLINELRRAIDFVSTIDLEEKRAIRDFAVEKAMQVNERDLVWYSQYEHLWKQLNARGEALRNTLDRRYHGLVDTRLPD